MKRALHWLVRDCPEYLSGVIFAVALTAVATGAYALLELIIYGRVR